MRCTRGFALGGSARLLNLWGADETRAVQRLAVEESRLGIPLLMGLDVIHGHRTIFPVPLAEACAFEPGLWEKTARAAAEEAAEDGVAMTFAPMLDVARDPRWGRIVESPGEDPWVASEIAAAKTRGFQGQDLAAADSLAATAKHFSPMAPSPRAANTHRPTCPRERCARSTCRRFQRLSPRERRRSCRLSSISPARR